MIIDKAQIEDANKILNLQILAFQSEAEIYTDWDIAPLKQTTSEIKKEIQDKTVLKAVVNNQIIGSVKAYENKNICYIERLIVHPDYKNQGIGTKLMQEIENIFNKATKYELFTGARSLKNIHLYEKIDYRIFKTELINNIKMVYLEKSRIF
ncbi:MAG: GNAT family N-acetyltransferase [Bacteroidetes bacterium]|nr:GNAT family N-acetyltransferase [Bacteroidota bacterium]